MREKRDRFRRHYPRALLLVAFIVVGVALVFTFAMTAGAHQSDTEADVAWWCTTASVGYGFKHGELSAYANRGGDPLPEDFDEKLAMAAAEAVNACGTTDHLAAGEVRGMSCELWAVVREEYNYPPGTLASTLVNDGMGC